MGRWAGWVTGHLLWGGEVVGAINQHRKLSWTVCCARHIGKEKEQFLLLYIALLEMLCIYATALAAARACYHHRWFDAGSAWENAGTTTTSYRGGAGGRSGLYYYAQHTLYNICTVHNDATVVIYLFLIACCCGFFSFFFLRWNNNQKIGPSCQSYWKVATTTSSSI